MNGSTIELVDGAGNAFDAYLSEPPEGSGPGIVVGLDIYGLRPTYQKMADMFAERGYIVLVPDIFWDVEPVADVNTLGREVSNYRTTLNMQTCIEATRTAMKALADVPFCTGGIGVIGFCLGGNLAYLGATRLGAEAAASYYGTRIHTFLDEVDQAGCPTLLHMAEHDSTYGDEDRDRILDAVRDSELIQTHVYEAPHGFANFDSPDVYDPAATVAAHERTFELFDRVLKG